MINKHILDFMKFLPYDSFINFDNELILNKKYNIFFRLGDVNDNIDIEAKLWAWASRPILKVADDKTAENLINSINSYLNTSFDKKDMEKIHCIFGNFYNRERALEFKNNNYDISIFCKNCRGGCKD